MKNQFDLVDGLPHGFGIARRTDIGWSEHSDRFIKSIGEN